jgi:hypothetical protein
VCGANRRVATLISASPSCRARGCTEADLGKGQFTPLAFVRLSVFVFSPTHKRTEGRAPEWGTEITTKVAPKGDSAEIAPGLNVKSLGSARWGLECTIFLYLNGFM